MASYAKHNSQGFLLFSLLLLAACSVIPARASARGGIDVMKSEDTMMKAKMGKNMAAAAVIHGGGKPDLNGCHYDELPHSQQNVFCCSKDKECWPSLQECIPNCPCKRKVNCSMKNNSEAVAHAAASFQQPLLHG